MRFLERARDSISGIIKAAERYPLVIIYLIIIAVLNGIKIGGGGSIIHNKLIVSFAVGAFLSALAEKFYEVFGGHKNRRLVFYPIVIGFSFIYFLLLGDIEFINTEIMARTTTIIFAIVMGFLLVPIIEEEYTLSDILLSFCKSLFLAGAFSMVIFAGVAAILGAIDTLLTSLPNEVYGHNSNIVFVLFLPIYFLSLLPDFKKDSRRDIAESFKSVKAVEILISYILIPIVSVFTLILAIYILRNITGEFWRDNLLEPMLLSYSIVVIFLYIFSGKVDNKIVSKFRDIFPKLLVPIVLFQTASSLITIRELGITHDRYYAILYGIFAIIASITFSIFRLSRNRAIMTLLIVLSLIAVIPPIDAFTISEKSQKEKLTEILENNNMVEGQAIVQNNDISEDNQRRITEIANYLYRMDYIGDLNYIPEDFNYYEDFEEIFGFEIYQREIERMGEYREYRSEESGVIEVQGYEYMVKLYFSSDEDFRGIETDNRIDIAASEVYTLGFDDTESREQIYLNRGESELASIKIEDMINSWDSDKSVKSIDEATFELESDSLSIKLLVNRIEIYSEGTTTNYSGEITVFLDEK